MKIFQKDLICEHINLFPQQQPGNGWGEGVQDTQRAKLWGQDADVHQDGQGDIF